MPERPRKPAKPSRASTRRADPQKEFPAHVPSPRQPLPHEEEIARIRGQLAARVDELTHTNWRVRVCERGHVIETHAHTANGDDEAVRCPMCGSLAVKEAPQRTAEREYTARTSPLAKLQQLADTMLEWGQRQLDAATWTTRSDEARKAAQQAQGHRPNGTDRVIS